MALDYSFRLLSTPQSQGIIALWVHPLTSSHNTRVLTNITSLRLHDYDYIYICDFCENSESVIDMKFLIDNVLWKII